jgi:hypothetical protein
MIVGPSLPPLVLPPRWNADSPMAETPRTSPVRRSCVGDARFDQDRGAAQGSGSRGLLGRRLIGRDRDRSDIGHRCHPARREPPAAVVRAITKPRLGHATCRRVGNFGANLRFRFGRHAAVLPADSSLAAAASRRTEQPSDLPLSNATRRSSTSCAGLPEFVGRAKVRSHAGMYGGTRRRSRGGSFLLIGGWPRREGQGTRTRGRWFRQCARRRAGRRRCARVCQAAQAAFELGAVLAPSGPAVEPPTGAAHAPPLCLDRALRARQGSPAGMRPPSPSGARAWARKSSRSLIRLPSIRQRRSVRPRGHLATPLSHPNGGGEGEREAGGVTARSPDGRSCSMTSARPLLRTTCERYDDNVRARWGLLMEASAA